MIHKYFDIHNRPANIVGKLVVSLCLVVGFTFLIWGLYGNLSNWNVPSSYKPKTKDKINLSDVLYFVVVSWFTIGYGDITASNQTLKVIVMAKIILSYIVLNI